MTLRRLIVALLLIVAGVMGVASAAEATSPRDLLLKFGRPGPTWDCNLLQPYGAAISAGCPGAVYTGPSLATQWNASGVLVYKPHNLAKGSEAVGGTGWNLQNGGTGSLPVATQGFAVSPIGTMTAARLQMDRGAGATSTDASYVQQGFGLSGTNSNIKSVYLKSNDGLTHKLAVWDMNPRGVNPTIITVTPTWQRFSWSLQNASGNCFIVFGLRGDQATDQTADILAWGGQFELSLGGSSTPSNYYPTTDAAAYYGPRFDYDPVTHAEVGYRAEDQRTNSLLNSGAPATQTVSLGAGTYTLWDAGSTCAVALSGGPTGTATPGAPATYTLAATTSVTFAVSGACDRVQNENGAYSTSYIPTYGAAVTRAADVDSASLSIGSVVSAVVSAMTPAGASGTQVLWQADDGTANNRITVQRNASRQIQLVVVSGGITQATVTAAGTVADLTAFKVAFRVQANDYALMVNGGTVATGSGAMPSGLATHRIGMDTGSSNNWNGLVSRDTVWLRNLPNSRLQTSWANDNRASEVA